MRKIAIILTVALCLTLCGCPAVPEITENSTPLNIGLLDVHITAGKIEPGMTAKDVFVEVTIDHQPVACRVELTALTNNGYYTMGENEPVEEDDLIRLDIFYSLPKGYTVDDINEVMDCDGGEYDGTGSVGYDDNGCVEAWSHAIYGEEPQEETQPEEQTRPETTSEPTPESQPHIHSWTENNPNSFYISCTEDRKKTYTCNCGETKTEIVPAPGHDLNEGAINPPTCTENGNQTKTCKRCGAGFIDNIPATGHSWTSWQWETGRVHKRTCSVCGEEEVENHDIPSGSIKCTDCGADIIN